MRIGVIGAGLMGSALARCLSSRGVEVCLYNRTRSKAEALAREIGARVYESPRRLLEDCEYTVAFVSDDRALREVVESIASGSSIAGKRFFVNASTITPLASLQAMSMLERVGVNYVEAPVYGSVDEARECRLISLVACRRGVLGEVLPAIKVYSQDYLYVGEPPKAAVLKLVLNNIGLAMPAILAESLMLLEAWGVELDYFSKAVEKLWFAPFVERYMKRVLEEKPARFKARLACKDYQYISESLREKGLPAMLSSTLADFYCIASTQGYGEKDYPRAAWFYVELAKKVRKLEESAFRS